MDSLSVKATRLGLQNFYTANGAGMQIPALARQILGSSAEKR
jgi:hypothetical protein